MAIDIVSDSKKRGFQFQVEWLKELESKETIYIIGHDKFDADSVIAGCLLENLLVFLKKQAQFIIIERVGNCDAKNLIEDNTTIRLLEKFMITSNERDLFLVDHYETRHAGNVLGCIDHHPTEKEMGYEFSLVRNSCATAFLVYELMKSAGYPISKEEEKWVLLAMINDTIGFRNSKTIPAEVEEAKEICKKNNWDFEQFRRQFVTFTPIEKMTIREIVTNGSKVYDYGDNCVFASSIQVTSSGYESKIYEWISYLQQNYYNGDYDLIVFIINDLVKDVTYEYQITRRKVTPLFHPKILSRGKDIMPRIERMLKKQDEEKVKGRKN